MIHVPVSYPLDWTVVVRSLPLLLNGMLLTVFVSVVAMVVALLLGIVVASAIQARLRPISQLAFVYVQVFRSLSAYIYILWVYYGIGAVAGLHLNPLVASVIALSCLHSAYLAEAIRSAIAAVDVGQWEAAASIGIDPIHTFFSIVLPQAARIALPSVLNQFIHLLKDSALLALVGMADLTFVTIQLVNFYSRNFEFYTATGLLYVGMVFIISSAGRWLEHRQNVWI